MAPTTDEPDARTRPDNPFPGPQPYVGAQRHVFFGRGDSVSTLMSLILSSHIVLLHAPSGAGKSSLLQAGLLPALEDAGIPMVATVRFAQERESDLVTGANSRVRGPEGDSFVDRTIGRLVGGGEPGVQARTIAEAVQTLRIPDGQIFVMLLDQFEELFADPAQWRARKEFLGQLAVAVDTEPRLRVILGMRSDYLAALIPYERDLPSRLVIRMSLPGLSDRAVEQVIKKAFVRSDVAITDRTIGELVESLFRTGGKDAPESARAEFANLIQLQILCRRAWDRLRDQTPTGGQVMEDIDLDVAGTMVSFVDAAVHSVATRASIDEAWIRCWLESLILPGNRRAIVSVEGLGDTVHEILDELEDARLLRLEYRNQSRLAELTHDSMVAALIESNRRWRRRARRARLRRSVLAIAVVVIMLTSFVAVHAATPAASVSLVDHATHSLASGEFDVSFVGSTDYPVAVVELWAQTSPGDVPITVSVAERRTNTALWTEVASRTYSPSGLDSSPFTGIAVETVAGSSYRVRTTSTDAVSPVDMSVTGFRKIEVLGFGGASGSASLDPIEGPDQQRAVRLPAGRYRVHGVDAVAAPRVFAMDDGDFVFELERAGVIVLTTYSTGIQTRISTLDSPGSLTAGTLTTKVGDLSLVLIDLTWEQVPTVLSIGCDRPISYSVRDETKSTQTSLSSRSPAHSHRALLTTPGSYLAILSGSGPAPSTCRVDVVREREVVRDLGVAGIDIGSAGSGDALAFRMSEKALLLAPLSEGIRYSYECADGSGSDGRFARGGEFAAVLPADVSCVLSVNRSGSGTARLSVITSAWPGSPPPTGVR